MYITKNNHIYEFKMINDELHLIVHHKLEHTNLPFKFKIMYDKLECVININIKKGNTYNIGKISNLNFIESNNLLDININNQYLEDNIAKFFPHFTIDYYINNNKFIDDNLSKNIKFVKYHWYLCGQFNPQIYYKYLLKKYSDKINSLKLDIEISDYSKDKKNTLLFVDDRYDLSFIYLLKLFLYSVDSSWNVTIFTIESNRDFFEKDLKSLGISGRINILNHPFKNNHEYSLLLMNDSFWNKIPEDNVLLFQYDSFCMGKFNDIFFNYNYIGARWPHNPLKNNINIGNGGTSFRKTRIMENICKKYKNDKLEEDLFFSYYLNKDKLNNCTEDIADKFSFENIYSNDSVYAHQIYNTVSLEDLDNFVFQKLMEM